MKLFITTICIGLALGSAGGALAQGVVDFRNGGITFPTPADRRCYLPNMPLTGVNFVAGLWYVEGDELSLLDSLSEGANVGRPFPFRPDTTAFKGIWVAPAGVSPLITLPGVTIGETAVLQVRVWDSAKYAFFDQAVAAGDSYYTYSCPFLYTVPSAGSTPDKYYMDNLRAFGVGLTPFCVPEPSWWALVAVGGLGWLAWCRVGPNRTR